MMARMLIGKLLLVTGLGLSQAGQRVTLWAMHVAGGRAYVNEARRRGMIRWL